MLISHPKFGKHVAMLRHNFLVLAYIAKFDYFYIIISFEDQPKPRHTQPKQRGRFPFFFFLNVSSFGSIIRFHFLWSADWVDVQVAASTFFDFADEFFGAARQAHHGVAAQDEQLCLLIRFGQPSPPIADIAHRFPPRRPRFQQAILHTFAMPSSTRPLIILGFFHHARPHRIALHIAQCSLKIVIIQNR